jgi:hypothetical protein
MISGIDIAILSNAGRNSKKQASLQQMPVFLDKFMVVY